jgi:hypothetical protein
MFRIVEKFFTDLLKAKSYLTSQKVNHLVKCQLMREATQTSIV